LARRQALREAGRADEVDEPDREALGLIAGIDRVAEDRATCREQVLSQQRVERRADEGQQGGRLRVGARDGEADRVFAAGGELVDARAQTQEVPEQPELRPGVWRARVIESARLELGGVAVGHRLSVTCPARRAAA